MAIHLEPLRGSWLRPAANCLIALLAGVGLASCASTSTKTNKDVAYSSHPIRIFVVANLSAFGGSFPEEFEKRMVTGVSSCGGSVEFSEVTPEEIANPLSLGMSPDVASASKARMEQIKNFSPEVILTMKVAHTTHDQYGQLLNATVDSYVWDAKSGKKIWAGVSSMSTGGMFTPASTRAQSLYDDLARRLRGDGMIPSCATP
jgi:hypothetical protein